MGKAMSNNFMCQSDNSMALGIVAGSLQDDTTVSNIDTKLGLSPVLQGLRDSLMSKAECG